MEDRLDIEPRVCLCKGFPSTDDAVGRIDQRAVHVEQSELSAVAHVRSSRDSHRGHLELDLGHRAS